MLVGYLKKRNAQLNAAMMEYQNLALQMRGAEASRARLDAQFAKVNSSKQITHSSDSSDGSRMLACMGSWLHATVSGLLMHGEMDHPNTNKLAT